MIHTRGQQLMMRTSRRRLCSRKADFKHFIINFAITKYGVRTAATHRQSKRRPKGYASIADAERAALRPSWRRTPRAVEVYDSD
jgi:hypothetical protein